MLRKNQATLTPEELKELSIGLLRDWWIATTQALVDTVGSEVALSHLKPYFIHSGKAGGIVFQKMTGIPSNCVPAIAHGTGAAMAIMFGGTLERGFMASDGSLIREITGCSTKGSCKEACAAFCYFACNHALIEYDPSYELNLTRSLAFGDDSCHWLIARKGQKPLVTAGEEFLTPVNYEQPYVPTEDLKELLSHAYAGECWVMTTRAFVDCVGSKKALESLCSYYGHSGMSLAIKLSDRLDVHDGNIETIVYIIDMIQALHQRKGTCSSDAFRAEGTINECPFSTSPPEMCAQYEAFFNGICESINPGYMFSYDRMMTRGEKNCHWVVKRINDEPKEASEQSAIDPQDALNILKKRLASGEISKDEYRELRDLLSES